MFSSPFFYNCRITNKPKKPKSASEKGENKTKRKGKNSVFKVQIYFSTITIIPKNKYIYNSFGKFYK